MLIALISFLGAIAREDSAALASDMRANAESISIEPAIRAVHKSVLRLTSRRRLAFSANIVYRIRIYMNSFF